jgi:hypothetical protein
MAAINDVTTEALFDLGWWLAVKVHGLMPALCCLQSFRAIVHLDIRAREAIDSRSAVLLLSK